MNNWLKMFNRISENPEEVRKVLELFTYTDEEEGRKKLSDILRKARLAWELNLPADRLDKEEARTARVALAKLISLKRLFEKEEVWEDTLKFLENGGEIDVSESYERLLANKFWAKVDKIAKAHGLKCDCIYSQNDLGYSVLSQQTPVSRKAYAGAFLITFEGKEAFIFPLEIKDKLAEILREFEFTLNRLEEEALKNRNQNFLTP